MIHPLIVRPCRDRAAFKVVPKRREHLDLARMARAFDTAREYSVVVSTPHVVVIRSARGGAEVTIYESGDMLVKGVQSPEEVRDVAHTILRVLEGARRRS